MPPPSIAPTKHQPQRKSSQTAATHPPGQISENTPAIDATRQNSACKQLPPRPRPPRHRQKDRLKRTKSPRLLTSRQNKTHKAKSVICQAKRRVNPRAYSTMAVVAGSITSTPRVASSPRSNTAFIVRHYAKQCKHSNHEPKDKVRRQACQYDVSLVRTINAQESRLPVPQNNPARGASKLGRASRENNQTLRHPTTSRRTRKKG
jgi:hypothetical protein